MIRLSKLTDYGIVLMTYFARAQQPQTARELSQASGLPLPTVTKILKLLAHEELLNSQRGVKGGYTLARSPQTISVAEVISVFEPIAFTECTAEGIGVCGLEPQCPVRSNWQKIGIAVRNALEELTLADMITSLQVAAPKANGSSLVSLGIYSGKVQ